jgi:hypothetical protein
VGANIEPRLATIAYEQGKTVECSQMVAGGFPRCTCR